MAVVPASIKAAFAEANQRWPGRSRASDGAIGDAAHAARKSDHNPDARGIIHAFDLTHDPINGVDCSALVKVLVANKDSRVNYIIWNRQMYDDGRRGAYGGVNPHITHMHVSIKHTPAAERDTSPWWTKKEKEKVMPTNEYPTNAPPVAILPHGSYGYWIVAADGGVFGFGNAPFLGSAVGDLTGGEIIVGAHVAGPGYRLLGSKGSVFCFDLNYLGRVVFNG